MKGLSDDGLENRARDVMIRQLRRNLKNCRKIMLDEKLDLKTRERWTQLYNNTSTVLNQILKDRQLRDWERRMRIIEEHDREQDETLGEPVPRRRSKGEQHEAHGSNESANQADNDPKQESVA